MRMSDKILRGLALNGNVRVLVAKTTDIVSHAQKIHGTYPAASAALGRVMSVASVMGSMLKDEREKLVIDIRSDGELNHIMVNADNRGFVRGLVSNPHTHKVNEANGKLDVGGVIGNGTLSVSQEFEGNTIFNSQVALQTGEIGEDFAFYFAQSEQIPSAVSVGVLVDEDLTIKSAGVILVQVLPSATDADIDVIEDVFSKLKPVSTLMIDASAEEVFNGLFEDIELLQETPIEYFCGCNRTQMEGALRTLDNKDLEEMIREDKGAELECHYCHSKYPFSEADLNKIITDRQNQS